MVSRLYKNDALDFLRNVAKDYVIDNKSLETSIAENIKTAEMNKPGRAQNILDTAAYYATIKKDVFLNVVLTPEECERFANPIERALAEGKRGQMAFVLAQKTNMYRDCVRVGYDVIKDKIKDIEYEFSNNYSRFDKLSAQDVFFNEIYASKGDLNSLVVFNNSFKAQIEMFPEEISGHLIGYITVLQHDLQRFCDAQLKMERIAQDLYDLALTKNEASPILKANQIIDSLSQQDKLSLVYYIENYLDENILRRNHISNTDIEPRQDLPSRALFYEMCDDLYEKCGLDRAQRESELAGISEMISQLRDEEIERI